MKRALIILLSGLFLCGCSEKEAASPKDFIQAGTDITCNGGLCVLHVTKRDGDLVSGIHCVINPGKKTEEVLTADTGTITITPLATTPDGHVFRMQLVLYSPKDQTGKPIGGDLTIALH